MSAPPITGRLRMHTKCCTNCFNHPWLKEYIHEESTQTGQCDYCGSRRRLLLPIGNLADYFQNLVGMYTDDGDGVSLIDAVQDEWYVFSDKLHTSGRSRGLLEDILNSDWDDDDGEAPVDAWDTVRRREVLPDLESWAGFCLDVREHPDLEPEFGDVFEEDLKNTSETLHAGMILFRARLGWSDVVRGRRQPFRGTEIAAPPPALASAGRANRQGRPVLYCAEDEPTAISEVRPARGYWVTTCQIRLTRDARILDLVDGIPIPNPFTNESLAWYVQFAELLRSFAEVLATPLARQDDVQDYLPSQKLCEYVERLGYDGVKYLSAAQDDGKNIVFFDPPVGEILESRLVEVTSTSIEFHAR